MKNGSIDALKISEQNMKILYCIYYCVIQIFLWLGNFILRLLKTAEETLFSWPT